MNMWRFALHIRSSRHSLRRNTNSSIWVCPPSLLVFKTFLHVWVWCLLRCNAEFKRHGPVNRHWRTKYFTRFPTACNRTLLAFRLIDLKKLLFFMHPNEGIEELCFYSLSFGCDIDPLSKWRRALCLHGYVQSILTIGTTRREYRCGWCIPR